MLDFIKLHGYGNDYIVIEADRLAGVGDLNDLIRRMCDRHYGAGADGVAVIGKADGPGADFTLRIFNADGGEAAMSGNGSRAAAAYLYYRGLWAREELRFGTRAGVKRYWLREDDGAGRYRFEAELGQPRFDSASIPMLTDEPLPQVVNYPLAVAGQKVRVTALQMCNPNCCIFIEDFAAIDWRRLGRAIEVHPQFPERTNVEFIRVCDRESIEVRIWERGVGETFSSGTGSCAAAIASCLNDLTGRRVNVQTPGGRLQVEWRDDGEVLLTGAAEVVYRGEWLRGKDEGERWKAESEAVSGES
jgi:diaminopimelate epimerase